MKKINKPDLLKWYNALPPAMQNHVCLFKRTSGTKKESHFIVCVGLQKVNQNTIIGIVSNNVFDWFETVQDKSFNVFKMNIFMYVETQYTILRKKAR